MTASERFDEKWMPEPNSGCWLWIANLNSSGYGNFWHDGRNVKAHRFAWERANGCFPVGKVTDHLCRVRCCVNPAHIEPVTVRENTMRGDTIPARNAAKMRCPRGHEYSVRKRTGGLRLCRTCGNEQDLARKTERRRKEALAETGQGENP